MKIAITAPFAEAQIEELEQDHEVLIAPAKGEGVLYSEDELASYLKENDIEILICESDKVTREVVENAPSLKMVCVCRAGVNDVDLDACSAANIRVVNTPGRNAAAVADMTVALFVDLARNLSKGQRLLREGEWDESTYFKLRGIELSGNVASFIGFGAVPRELSRRLSAFGMIMQAYDPYVGQEAMDFYGVKKVDLETAFSEGDFVSNHLPVTEDTFGLISMQYLKMMKQSAFFINTARAATVNTEDIIEVLQNEQIAGAAFDVFDEEPLKPDSPFLQLDNAVLLPHLGGASFDVVKSHSRMVAADIKRFAEGQTPVNLCK